MKNKKVIDKYSQPIYVPQNLYICKNYTKADIDKLFYIEDHQSVLDAVNMDDYDALTIRGVYEVATSNICTIILINTEGTDSMSTEQVVNLCAHEAFHVAHRMLDLCGLTLSDDSCESFAFVTGWAAECMFKTMTK